ncbi:MAG: hypothetical protein A2252_00630 [Elusimicrobia bacterium RIFOXYA2_FULL_39_19]|nr:MAG: hypothetical protein A2252_00630 [Elusimicrobia bacterium RIFOXYA2_FULL_39_19]
MRDFKLKDIVDNVVLNKMKIKHIFIVGLLFFLPGCFGVVDGTTFYKIKGRVVDSKSKAGIEGVKLYGAAGNINSYSDIVRPNASYSEEVNYRIHKGTTITDLDGNFVVEYKHLFGGAVFFPILKSTSKQFLEFISIAYKKDKYKELILQYKIKNLKLTDEIITSAYTFKGENSIYKKSYKCIDLGTISLYKNE